MGKRLRQPGSPAAAHGEETLVHMELPRTFTEQTELLESAAPNLRPCPVFLCYPITMCEYPAAAEFATKSAPCLRRASSPADVLSIRGGFTRRQLKKHTRETCSLARAVCEASPTGQNVTQFSVSFKTFAEAALGNMRRCDFCGTERQPHRAEDNALKEVGAAAKKARTDKGSVDTARGSAAVCVIPRVVPETRAVILTPPKVRCGATPSSTEIRSPSLRRTHFVLTFRCSVPDRSPFAT